MVVSQLPATLRTACLNRGMSDSDAITPRDAVSEWSGWELGDPHWARTILDLHEAAVEAEKASIIEKL